MTTTTERDQLAGLAAQLAALDYAQPTPHRDALADAMRGRTWTMPRGVTFAVAAEGASIYLETHHGTLWNEDGRTRSDARMDIDVTVYGTLTRGQRETRGSVDVRHLERGEYQDGETERGYFRHLTGPSVPDGARADTARAVLADVLAALARQGTTWEQLADETDAAKRDADVRHYISEAVRAIEEAGRRLAGRTQR